MYCRLESTSKKTNAVSAWKPRLYTGINLFIPRNEYEEVILLLLISEAMAVREAVLSQSPEFKEVRIRALSNAMVIYDLLTIALVRWGQVSLLYECLERAMKFSYEEAHIWLQQALCLESMGHHVHALAVLKEVVRLLPTKVMPCLIAARICYQHLNQISEGMQWSMKALARQTSHPQNLLSRCHLYIGIGAHYGAVISHLKQEKQRLHSLAAESFLKSQQNDPNDHLVEYYLGLQCASRAQVSEAIAHTKAALKLCPEHAPSLHLMVLLLTAQKQLTEAHTLLDTALQDFPDNLNLLYIKTHLQLQTHGPEVALATAKQMLSLWKILYEEQVQQVQGEQSDTRSFFQLYTSEMSDKDSSSLHAHSLAASRVEQALSEVASSISSFTPRPGPQRAWLLQLQVWLLVAEIYLALDQVSAAAASIQEATSIFPLSHHIMYTRGLVHEHKHEFMEAKQCYQNAVAINPSHIKSLQHLGLMYHYLGSHRLAEKTLRDAAKIDPHAPTTW
ncbi:Tetratricopeptide repeat protein 7B [Homalodisca vitripennis]|nr:Tetratricopeptide repeat protein 7B [Homalodisca vitripennis]